MDFALECSSEEAIELRCGILVYYGVEIIVFEGQFLSV